MKIYTKILLITIPLIILPTLIVSLAAYQIFQTAIHSMAQDTLKTYLAKAIEICVNQANAIQNKDQEKISQAQKDAAIALQNIKFGNSGYVMIVDDKGYVISYPITQYVQPNFGNETWFTSLHNKDKGSISYSFLGKTRLAYYQHFADWGWYLISNETESELLAPVSRITLYAALLIGITLIIGLIVILILARRLTNPLQALLAGTEKIRNGDLDVSIRVKTNDEIGALANAFNIMSGQLRHVFSNLEQRVIDRTKDLEKRALYLKTASDIARDAVTTRDLDHLLNRSVELIQNRFEFYYVGIFFIDEQSQSTVIRAGAGEAGKVLVNNSFQVQIGGTGILSQVVKTGETFVINDVIRDFTYEKNPLLPGTASEAAFPLKTSSRILGLIDFQSRRVDDFTPDIIEILQTMADQLAVAIENIRLLDELETSLEETRGLFQHYVQESWSQTTVGNQNKGYEYNYSRLYPLTNDIPIDIRNRLALGKAIQLHKNLLNGEGSVTAEDNAFLIAPLILYGQLIGVLGVEGETPDHVWTSEEVTFLETISHQVSQTLENARLMEETQRKASRDRLISEITNKMRRAVDMDSLIQTTVHEITKAIGVPEGFIQLGISTGTEAQIETIHEQ